MKSLKIIGTGMILFLLPIAYKLERPLVFDTECFVLGLIHIVGAVMMFAGFVAVVMQHNFCNKKEPTKINDRYKDIIGR